MNEALQFFKDNPTFFLSSMDEGGQPRVRPFGAVAKFEDKLYLVTSNEKDVYKQLKNNPKLELCGVDKENNYIWVRVTAEAVFDERPQAKLNMLDDCPFLKDIYAVDDGKMEVFYLKNAQASFFTMTGEPHIINF